MASLVLCAVVAAVVKTAVDGRREEPQNYRQYSFVHEVMNKYTPVKNQGKDGTCWAYAMLAAIETEHLMRGDSVNLSPYYAVRSSLEEQMMRYYLSMGQTAVYDRGTGHTLLNTLTRKGMVGYDAYHPAGNPQTAVVISKITHAAQAAIHAKVGLQRYRQMITQLLDESFGAKPKQVYMLGAQYTPQEFARSVCAPDEYASYTSFSHHAMGSRYVLEVADNWEHNETLNLPLDTLVQRVVDAVKGGHGVCWEGDISEPGFSFRRGIAVLPAAQSVSQQARQEEYESFKTTDDHCMSIVGLARDAAGKRYFVMKNSWGTGNPYGGLMYMSEDYLRMKTIAVFMPCTILP